MKHRYKQGEISEWELLKGLGAYLRYKLGLLDIATWSRDMMQQFKGESERALARDGEGLDGGGGGADHLPGGRGAGRRAPGEGSRGRDRFGSDEVRGQASRGAPRDQASALHASRSREGALHGSRGRADLLRGWEDLLAPPAGRESRTSTWRRATSTPTRSPTCRCSIWSAIRWSPTRIRASTAKPCDAAGRSASSSPREIEPGAGAG